MSQPARSQKTSPLISVVGTGYLGATHAACMAKLGCQVIGIDVDPEKISALSQGQLPFYEPGLPELLQAEIAAGHLTFTTDFAALADAAVHFICVGTPQVKDGLAADLTYVDAAFTQVAKIARNGALLVGKSTVPVGTAQRLAGLVAAINPTLRLAWNPEFLREGFAVEDTLNPNRLVVGVTSDEDEANLKEVYATNLASGVPWVRANLATAELVKVAANSFLATKISFINAMSEICEVAGGDVTVLAKAIGYDPRIGNRFLQAGIGFGGGCLPKDIRAFMARAGELGAEPAVEFLREIDAINLRARTRIIDLVRADLAENLAGHKIAILGAAFKPDSDDVRDSPALDIAVQLHAAGADVVVHDPKAIKNAELKYPALRYEPELTRAITGAELILHLTEWREYRELIPAQIGELVTARRIIDGRNMLDRAAWQSAGFSFRALGRADQ